MRLLSFRIFLNRRVLSNVTFPTVKLRHFCTIVDNSDNVSPTKIVNKDIGKKNFIESLKSLSKQKDIEARSLLTKYLESDDWKFIVKEMKIQDDKSGFNRQSTFQINMLLKLINSNENSLLYDSLLDYLILHKESYSMSEMISILYNLNMDSKHQKLFLAFHHQLKCKMTEDHLSTYRRDLFDIYVNSCLWQEASLYLDTESVNQCFKYLIACANHLCWEEFRIYLKKFTSVTDDTHDDGNRFSHRFLMPILRALRKEPSHEIRTEILNLSLLKLKDFRAHLTNDTVAALKAFFIQDLKKDKWMVTSSPTIQRQNDSSICLSCDQALDPWHIDQNMTDLLLATFKSSFLESSDSYLYHDKLIKLQYEQFLEENGSVDLSVDFLNFLGLQYHKVFINKPHIVAKHFIQYLEMIINSYPIHRICLFYKENFPLSSMDVLLNSLRDHFGNKLDISHFRPPKYQIKNSIRFMRICHDDIFVLCAALNSGPHCYMLSSDQYTDYQHQLGPKMNSLFYYWKRARLIQMTKYTPITPSPFSETIQGSMEKGWHIPYSVKEIFKDTGIEPRKKLICLKKSSR